jgi:hypothetical protein
LAAYTGAVDQAMAEMWELMHAEIERRGLALAPIERKKGPRSMASSLALTTTERKKGPQYNSEIERDLRALGMAIADENSIHFGPIKALPIDLNNLHLTFVNETGIVSTFGRDNAEHLRSWWLVQCAKLNNPLRKDFWLLLNKREFTSLHDPQTNLPIKRLSGCLFRQGMPPKSLTADEIRQAFNTNAETGERLPPQTDIVFVDFGYDG